MRPFLARLFAAILALLALGYAVTMAILVTA